MNTKSKHGDEVRQKILSYLKSKVEPIAPLSYREIADACGFASTNTIEHHLRMMESDGIIELLGVRNIRVKDGK